MVGVWIDPVTAQVMMTFLAAAAMACPPGSFTRTGGVHTPGQSIISPVRADEVTHLREDLLAPTAAVEDAVVPEPRLQVMSLAACGNPRTELERGPGLAGGADVVVLALDAEECGLGDRCELDLAAARHK